MQTPRQLKLGHFLLGMVGRFSSGLNNIWGINPLEPTPSEGTLKEMAVHYDKCVRGILGKWSTVAGYFPHGHIQVCREWNWWGQVSWVGQLFCQRSKMPYTPWLQDSVAWNDNQTLNYDKVSVWEALTHICVSMQDLAAALSSKVAEANQAKQDGNQINYNLGLLVVETFKWTWLLTVIRGTSLYFEIAWRAWNREEEPLEDLVECPLATFCPERYVQPDIFPRTWHRQRSSCRPGILCQRLGCSHKYSVQWWLCQQCPTTSRPMRLHFWYQGSWSCWWHSLPRNGYAEGKA